MGKMWQTIHRRPLLRRVALALLKRINPGDIRITHHYTGDRVFLHSFRHKGYWYHGKRRESETMEFFAAAIQPGDTVIEVGGHIGYISMYLSSLVGADGRLFVFEPGSNNRRYIEENLKGRENCELVYQAVSDKNGTARFFEEELTGQNNSLLSDYRVFRRNKEASFSAEDYVSREVPTIRLDTFVKQKGITPTLIKIDVEGAEWLVLQGARALLANSTPALMIEVTNEQEKVLGTLSGLGYTLFDERGNILTAAGETTPNVFALILQKHQAIAEELGWRKHHAVCANE